MVKPLYVYCSILLVLQAVSAMPFLVTAAAVGGIASACYNLGKGIVSGVMSLDRKLSDPANRGPNIERPDDPLVSDIMDMLQYFSKRRDQFKVDIENFKNDVISRITHRVPAIVELNRRFSELFVKSVQVDESYDNFLKYATEPNKYDKDMIVKFATDAVAENNCGMQHIINEIHTLLTMGNFATPSIVSSLQSDAELFIEYSKTTQNPQQFFYSLLISVLYTKLKGYITLSYSYQILQKYKHGNYENHLLKLDEDFSSRINTTISIFKTAMASASREIWINNPINHEENKTYIELKHVFNKIFMNEYDLDKSGLCTQTCQSIKRVLYPLTGDDCYYELCKKQRRCNGKLYDCEHAFDTTMSICLEENSDKRYRSLIVHPGMRYGSVGSCPSNPISFKASKAVITLSSCDPCMCICDEFKTEDSIRHFNMEPSISRFQDNYVMTGTRFVRHGNSIYLQVQEGQLLPNGHINESTIGWVPIKFNTKSAYTLDWSEKRYFILNDIEVPKDNVLVGMSFDQFYEKSSSYPLRLKVIYAPINFTSGLVLSKSYKEQVNHNVEFEIDVENLAIPTLSSNQNVRTSKPNRKIGLTTSSLFGDVGQTTVPFIDIQSVVTNPPAAMSGAGLYHKITPGTAGFIALKLLTYNVEPHLLADISGTKDVLELRHTVDNQSIKKKIH